MLRQCLFFLVCISFCAATRNSVPTGIADHYCCSVPNKVETIETRTRIVTQINIVTSQVISNYTYCPPLDDLIDHIISNLGSNPLTFLNFFFIITLNLNVYFKTKLKTELQSQCQLLNHASANQSIQQLHRKLMSLANFRCCNCLF